MSEHRYEKMKYTVFDIPEKIEGSEWKWCYSAKELEQELRLCFVGKAIKGVYAELKGYLTSSHHSVDYIDLSFEGGGCVIVFENAVLELGLHAEGQFNYRIDPLEQIKTHSVKDYPPDDCNEIIDCFLDIENHDITVKIAGQTVKDIRVPGTDMWSFSLEGFDEHKARVAAKKCDLPSEIDLYMDGYIIRLIGDDMEYYKMCIDKVRET